jgi:hypothetical protein
VLRLSAASSGCFRGSKSVTPEGSWIWLFVLNRLPIRRDISTYMHTIAPQLAHRKTNITVLSPCPSKSPRQQQHNSHEMPPRKQKQIASASASASSNELIPSFPAPPAMLPTKTGEEDTHTPERSPAKRGAMTITEAQKQALMDNLQLEGKALQDHSRLGPANACIVTERARKLRAQYALQAQGLRARLEMRVNRIPQALRKRNMQDLLDDFAEKAKPRPAAIMPVVDSRQRVMPPSSTRKSLKRTRYEYTLPHARDLANPSSEHFGTENKENAYAQGEIPNPKKRTKTATAAPTATTKTASRKPAPTTVLSPKSNNTHALPRSPIKSTTIEKLSSFASSRPASPMKPTVSSSMTRSPNPSSRAQSRQTKRPVTVRTAPLTSERRESDGSSTSAGTTVVSKAGAKKAAPARKAPTAKAPAATTKRAPTAKKEPAAPPVGGRTLRKRA